jgi:TRAP-type C4-dicarboxylate transport system permease small subunit
MAPRAKYLALATLLLACLSASAALSVFATSYFVESLLYLISSPSPVRALNLLLAFALMVAGGALVLLSAYGVLWATGQPSGGYAALGWGRRPS